MNPSILPVMGILLKQMSYQSTAIECNCAITTVKPFLSQVEGVSEVRIIGGKQKEYWLTLDPQKMSTLCITPDALSNALNQTNFIQSNGYRIRLSSFISYSYRCYRSYPDELKNL